MEGIIGDMLFDPDDDDAMTKERFMSVFKFQDDTFPEDHVYGGATTSNAGEEHYVATVASKVQFYSCIKEMIASGLLFRQASRVMQDMKETLSLSTLGFMTPQKVSSFVQIICAANLQTGFLCSDRFLMV